MADQLYLSLWFPNFRLETLPAALVSVMRQFALISGEGRGGAQAGSQGRRVQAAAVYPLSFSEAPAYQRLYVIDERAEDNGDTSASIIETAVAEATELLHDDMAYEFEMKWRLWTPDSGPGSGSHGAAGSAILDPGGRLDTLWQPQPTTVKIIGFGPHFDDASFEQNGHIRIDFGLDYPWILDDDRDGDADGERDGDEDTRDDEGQEDDIDQDHLDPSPSSHAEKSTSEGVGGADVLPFKTAPRHVRQDPVAESLSDDARYIQRNVEMLLAFTLSVEKHCGVSSRLLWTESGEPLAEKLIARLQRLH